MPKDARDRARELAQRYLAAGDPTGWFEPLYAEGLRGEAEIPWAGRGPNPHLVEWLDAHPVGPGARALVVGCGLGDDAERLAADGAQTTAFDVSPTAIQWARRRFPESRVAYVVADLFRPPAEWRRAFDFVFEAYTFQALPETVRPAAMRSAAEFVGPGGRLLVVCRGRDAAEPPGQLPWPLTRAELGALEQSGLAIESFEDFVEDGDPPIRRFRAVCRRG
jgi:SAM-dependent methyltransferase